LPDLEKIVGHVVKLGLGLVALANGDAGGGAATVAALGEAGAFALGQIQENQKVLLTSFERAVTQQREELLPRWRGREKELAAIATVDAILEGEADCLLDGKTLADLAAEDDFVGAASAMIVQRLGLTAAEGHPEFAIGYATSLVAGGLGAIVLKPEFFAALQGPLATWQARQTRLLNEKVDRLSAQIRNEVPRSVLEALAYRFGHTNPDATVQELEEYLTLRAAELGALRARLAELDATNERVHRAREASEAAIARGSFTEARACLEDALEVQLHEDVIPKLRSMAEIYALKADTFLIEGEVSLAANEFEKAVSLFTEINTQEAAKVRAAGAASLAENARRFGGTGARIAAGLLEKNLDVYSRDLAFDDWARTRIDLANFLRRESAIENTAVPLIRAEGLLRELINHIDPLQHRSHLAQSLHTLGFILRDRAASGGERGNRIRLMMEAIQMGERVIELGGINNDVPSIAIGHSQVGTYRNDLGLLLNLNEAVQVINEAASSFREALALTDRHVSPLDWAMDQGNLATSHLRLANRSEGLLRAHHLRRSIKHLNLARKVWQPQSDPLGFSTAYDNLGLSFEGLGDLTQESRYHKWALRLYSVALSAIDPRRFRPQHAEFESNHERVRIKLMR
jgi:tetratricopeptide (TPR) repeat protein